MKLFNVVYKTPHSEGHNIVIEAENSAVAKTIFQKVLTSNAYIKLPFEDRELLIQSCMITIKKITEYK